MPIWERYTSGVNITTQGDHNNELVFENEETSDNFQNTDVVAVDGILTVHTNTDDLMGLRLLVSPNSLVDADFTEDDPTPDDPQVWYNFFCARGPMVFRLRSKKTIPPHHNLWLQVWKASGSTATAIRTGLQVLWVLKR